MALNPRNLTISGVFLAFARFFATMRFADTECRKKDIILKKRLPAECWTAFACGESAVPFLRAESATFRVAKAFYAPSAFFVFLFVKYLYLPERRFVIGYIYKKEDCDCRYENTSITASTGRLNGQLRQFFSPPWSSLWPVLYIFGRYLDKDAGKKVKQSRTRGFYLPHVAPESALGKCFEVNESLDNKQWWAHNSRFW